MAGTQDDAAERGRNGEASDGFAYDDTEPVPEDAEGDEDVRRQREEVLHYERVRRSVLTRRRDLFRTRGYYLLGVVGCLAAAGQLVWMTYRYVYAMPQGWRLRPAGYVVAAIAALIGAVAFARRVREMNRELAVPVLDEPAELLDFSTLSDGSQRWRNLEAMAATERQDVDDQGSRSGASEWRS